MKKRKTIKKVTEKKNSKNSSSVTKREKGLNFMIQVEEPKNLRKDILEALREIIIFMQGYESFVKIQEEKILAFSKLHRESRELNNLIDNKLRQYLPKGKLKGISPQKTEKEEAPIEIKKPAILPKEFIPPVQEAEPEKNELDRLESQLQDIENRLKNI